VKCGSEHICAVAVSDADADAATTERPCDKFAIARAAEHVSVVYSANAFRVVAVLRAAVVLSSTRACAATVIAFAVSTTTDAAELAAALTPFVGAVAAPSPPTFLVGTFRSPDTAAAAAAALFTPLNAADVYRTLHPLSRDVTHVTASASWRGDVVAVAPAAWLYGTASVSASASASARHIADIANNVLSARLNVATSASAAASPFASTSASTSVSASASTGTGTGAGAVTGTDAIVAPGLASSVFFTTYQALATRVVLACTAALKHPASSAALDPSLTTPLMQRYVAEFLRSGAMPSFVHAARAERLQKMLRKHRREPSS
jgi:hypothetical protein